MHISILNFKNFLLLFDKIVKNVFCDINISKKLYLISNIFITTINSLSSTN